MGAGAGGLTTGGGICGTGIGAGFEGAGCAVAVDELEEFSGDEVPAANRQNMAMMTTEAMRRVMMQ